MKTKAELLVRKMKADPNIAWSEKGELKYKGETVRGSNVVDLVNDVLSHSLRRSSVDRSSLSSMDSIFLSKVSMTFTRCSTGGFGRP
jgi:hypothetical protein